MSDKAVNKNTTSDFQAGLQLVRDVTVADSNSTAATLAPGAEDTIASVFATGESGLGRDSGPTGLFLLGGARTVKLRVWSNIANGTVQVQLKEWAWPGPRRQTAVPGAALTKSKGDLVLDYTFVTNGSTTANTHPVTGATVAATTFYEASSISVKTYDPSLRIREFPSGDSSNTGEKILLIDAMGSRTWYPQVAALGANATRAVIALQKVD